MSEAILLERADGVAVITLNRPDKLNALAGTMRDDLLEAVKTVGADAKSRVLVITGAGRGFCAGGDMAFMADLKGRNAPFDEIGRLMDSGRAVIEAIRELDRPVIAAVNGPAAGAGLNLALACDLRIAHEKASFGATFVKIGLHPDWGGSWLLPRIVGASRALKMIWTGEVITAQEAHRIGLCDEVHAADAFAGRVKDLAARLAQAPPVAVAAAKKTVYAAATADLNQAFQMEMFAQRACWDSADSAEGITAFLEKRPARFSGKG